ncbi:hypothetical protein DUI87_01290 [Hirundo rustica rustica]|uniref:Uncharacterized protein n=1 Tax=Hirundo rustica rustica TaxID=333673 RepID=A0A3M0LBL8_HIRRU|nr:hypothetical protein DUI87_01290 [Hirundo rustica rustica]
MPLPLPRILEREQKATENGNDSPEDQMITSDQYLDRPRQELTSPHHTWTQPLTVLSSSRPIQTLRTETCMINEDAPEEGPSKSRASLLDPVYKKRLLQTKNVNLGDNRLPETLSLMKSLRQEAQLAQTLPLDFAVHSIQPGYWVLVKEWKEASLVLKWRGSFQVLLITETSIKTTEHEWTHHTWVKVSKTLEIWTSQLEEKDGRPWLTLSRCGLDQ